VPFNYQQEQGSITLSAIRRLYRRNVRVTLYKLIEKAHPAKMAWVYPYLSPNERRDILEYIQRMDEISNFLDELDFDTAISTDPFVTTTLDIIGVFGYYIIPQNLYLIS